MSVGKVYLVGAGPGDPKLLTLRAVEVLRESAVLLVDHLVDPAVLAHARPGARIVDTGKRGHHACIRQEEINALMIGYAREGLCVARVKGGDPFIFGRGGEEAEALVRAGVLWEVVPGVSSGIAAAAYAGIPLLHREHASSVTFVSGHAPEDLDRSAFAAQTLVIFMGGANLSRIARRLIAGGRAPSTPVALLQAGTLERQRVHVGTLEELARASSLTVERPVLTVVGPVVRLARKLHWFGGPVGALAELTGEPLELAG